MAFTKSGVIRNLLYTRIYFNILQKGKLIPNLYTNIKYSVGNKLSKPKRYKIFSWNARLVTKNTVFAGLLSWLGWKEKDKEEDTLITTIKLGILNLQREQYDKAESIFHIALKLAQERADPEAQNYIYDMLANTAYQKRDYPKAEKLFVEVIKRLLASGISENDNSIVEISLKLASIYDKQQEKIKAEEGFKFCIRTQEKKMTAINLDNVETLTELDRDTVTLWAMSIDWYARYLMAAGNLKSAQQYFEKALSMSEKINGPSHPQTLVLINDIGSVASLCKDFSTALEYFNKAIARGTGSGTPDLPAFYCNLGATYLQQGDLVQASEACSKALKLAQNLSNKEAESDALGCLEELKKFKENVAAS